MRSLVVLTVAISALSVSVGAESTEDPQRDALLDELSVRLQAQLVELPKGMHIRGNGTYRKIRGRGVASPFVNTPQRAPGEVVLNTESHEVGVFAESSESISYEGLHRESPAGMGSRLEQVSSDFYKSRTAPGWIRIGNKQVAKPSASVRFSHAAMEKSTGYGTIGVGPINAQRTLANLGLFDIIVNRVDEHLDIYRIEASDEGTLRTFTMNWTVTAQDYSQHVRFVFDDSRNGLLVQQEVKLINPETNYVGSVTEARSEYAPAPSVLVEAGIPYLLSRVQYVEKASQSQGGELLHMKSLDFRFTEVQAIAGEPAPPEWYTKWQQALKESDDYTATLAAKGS